MLPYPGMPYNYPPGICYPLTECCMYLLFILCCIHAYKKGMSNFMYLESSYNAYYTAGFITLKSFHFLFHCCNELLFRRHVQLIFAGHDRFVFLR